mmetsp:Transcript_8097/g.12285  ORF Transcript_8097/g.12285 Transcript_8097/m.12285 type:complete len:162 (-) Transcript_8097:304-789(-)
MMMMMMTAVLKAVMDGQQSTDTEEEEEETDDSPNYESNDDEERTFVSLVCNDDPDTVDMLLEEEGHAAGPPNTAGPPEPEFKRVKIEQHSHLQCPGQCCQSWVGGKATLEEGKGVRNLKQEEEQCDSGCSFACCGAKVGNVIFSLPGHPSHSSRKSGSLAA